MHSMLDMSMWLSIAIGIVLFIIARRGKVMWMTVWSIGLVVCSLAYLGADAFGLF